MYWCLQGATSRWTFVLIFCCLYMFWHEMILYCEHINYFVSMYNKHFMRITLFFTWLYLILGITQCRCGLTFPGFRTFTCVFFTVSVFKSYIKALIFVETSLEGKSIYKNFLPYLRFYYLSNDTEVHKENT